MRDFIESLLPGFGERVQFFESRENIFEHFGIEKELTRALSRKVWLKSGGYLVFDRTEAMTVVDVNTGKFVGKKDLQETVLKTNLEAAEEIARQVRLRDIGGIILIDFIDMNKKEHRKQVIKTLENSLLKDRTRCSVIDMSDLGLVEMTRKRVKKGLDYFLQEPCSNCKGEGKVLSLETIAVGFLRKLEEICRNSSAEFVGATVGSELKQYLDEIGGKFIERLERIYKKKIEWKFDDNLPPRRYSIVGVGSEEEVRKRLEEIA
jgi:ribonuclease G